MLLKNTETHRPLLNMSLRIFLIKKTRNPSNVWPSLRLDLVPGHTQHSADQSSRFGADQLLPARHLVAECGMHCASAIAARGHFATLLAFILLLDTKVKGGPVESQCPRNCVCIDSLPEPRCYLAFVALAEASDRLLRGSHDAGRRS